MIPLNFENTGSGEVAITPWTLGGAPLIVPDAPLGQGIVTHRLAERLANPQTPAERMMADVVVGARLDGDTLRIDLGPKVASS